MPGRVPDSRAPAEPRIEPFASGLLVTLSGELDAFDAPSLRASFAAVIEAAPRVVVLNLAAVAFLDSTILGALVGLLRRLREAGGELRVVLPDGTARRIFEITGLDSALDVRSTVEDAKA